MLSIATAPFCIPSRVNKISNFQLCNTCPIYFIAIQKRTSVVLMIFIARVPFSSWLKKGDAYYKKHL